MDFTADGASCSRAASSPARWSRVDLARAGRHRPLHLGAGAMPQDVKLAPDGRAFYVAEMTRGGVYVIDGRRCACCGFIRTGAGAHGLYPSRDARLLYVTNRSAGTVSVLRFATRRIVATWRSRTARPTWAASPPTAGRSGCRAAIEPRCTRSTRAPAGSGRGSRSARPARPLRLAAARPLLARAHGNPPLALLRELSAPGPIVGPAAPRPLIDDLRQTPAGASDLACADRRRRRRRSGACSSARSRPRATPSRRPPTAARRWPRSSARCPTRSCSTSRCPASTGSAVTRRLRGKGLARADPAADRARRRRASAWPGSTPAPTTTSSSRSPSRSCPPACARCCAAATPAGEQLRVRRPDARPRSARAAPRRRPRPRADAPRGRAARAAAAQRRARSSPASWRSRRSGAARAGRRRTSVDRYVAYLRRKLGDPPLIHTVRGVGFLLDRMRPRAQPARCASALAAAPRSCRGRRCSASRSTRAARSASAARSLERRCAPAPTRSRS